MAINLQKGQRESITHPKFTIGLGWDTNQTSTGAGFDLDASVFILGDNKKNSYRWTFCVLQQFKVG